MVCSPLRCRLRCRYRCRYMPEAVVCACLDLSSAKSLLDPQACPSLPPLPRPGRRGGALPLEPPRPLAAVAGGRLRGIDGARWLHVPMGRHTAGAERGEGRGGGERSEQGNAGARSCGSALWTVCFLMFASACHCVPPSILSASLPSHCVVPSRIRRPPRRHWLPNLLCRHARWRRPEHHYTKVPTKRLPRLPHSGWRPVRRRM